MRRAAILVGSLLLVVALAHPAAAAWLAHSHPTGRGGATAMAMPVSAIPGAVVAGNTVTVSWPATISPPATGYTVRVFDALSGVERPIGGGCAGVVAGVTCTETAVPDGTWRYSLMARLENWSGPESSRSAAVTVETVPPEPIALTLDNAPDGTPGVLDPEGDEVDITYSEPLAVNSICSTWVDDASDHTLSGTDVEVTMTSTAGFDTLTVATSQCTLNLGSIALGTDYLATPTATFSGSGAHSTKISWHVATRTLTIHVGQLATGTLAATPVSPTTATYTPAAALQDLAHNAVTTPLVSTNQRF